MAVRTVFPRHEISRGRPTLTEIKRAIGLFSDVDPQSGEIDVLVV
jgi:hypothetical protein